MSFSESIDTKRETFFRWGVLYGSFDEKLGFGHSSIVSMKYASDESVGGTRIPPPERLVMKSFTLGLLGAAALATTILLVRQSKDATESEPRVIPAGETQPSTISLDRIRELGL